MKYCIFIIHGSKSNPPTLKLTLPLSSLLFPLSSTRFPPFPVAFPPAVSLFSFSTPAHDPQPFAERTSMIQDVCCSRTF